MKEKLLTPTFTEAIVFFVLSMPKLLKTVYPIISLGQMQISLNWNAKYDQAHCVCFACGNGRAAALTKVIQ